VVCCEGAAISISGGDRVTCDVVDFMEAIKGGRNIITDRKDCLSSSASLYRGPFLNGFSLPDCPVFDDWQFEKQQDLLVHHTLALEELIDILIKEGSTEKALGYARTLLDLDPSREDRHRMIMELNVSLGNYTAALGQFDLLKHQLQRDGQPNPESETLEIAKSLYGKIKNNCIPYDYDGKPEHRRRNWIPFTAAAVVMLSAVVLIFFVWKAEASPRGPVSIAVMPFRFLCLGDGVEQAAENFTSEMITTLARDPFFAVTPHGSVRQYRETIKTVAEIADELDVDYILEGVTQTQGNQIRFSVQLIDSKRDECIWADMYEGDLTGGLAFQQEVTEYLVKCIKHEAQNR
jgi:TolB-like protein